MIINSILDNDLYKFTTSYAYMKLYPHAIGTFEFVDRNNTEYTKEQLQQIGMEITHMDSLKLTEEERKFMIDSCYYIPPCYFEWLSGYKYDRKEVNIWLDENNHLHIKATGLLYRITLWEVPILAIVSEVLTRSQGPINLATTIAKTVSKASLADNSGIKFSEFGTRRRASFAVQDAVVKHLAQYTRHSLTGTSNCYLAMKYNLTPIGTHPHEWFMFHGAQYGYDNANYLALEAWAKVYDGDLGIALSDTYTSDVFLKNFSKKHAKLFDGVRQDSGDPFKFINKVINRYKELKIDPTTKTIIFSDALTMDKAVEIHNSCYGRIRAAFGIGTHLTNDVGLKPANIVMKLTSCQMNAKQPERKCVKISDSVGKHMGDPDEVALACMLIKQHYGVEV